MINPYIEYYENQAGNGLSGFEGYKFQKGNGFFGNLFRYVLKPLGLYVGKQALSTGINAGADILNGDNLKDAFRKSTKKTADKVLDDAIGKLSSFKQKGSGKRRKRAKKNNIKLLKLKKKRNKSVSKKKSKRKVAKRKKSKKSDKVNIIRKSKFSHLLI